MCVSSYFKQWFFSNPFWAAVVIVLAIPNVEVVALCRCVPKSFRQDVYI